MITLLIEAEAQGQNVGFNEVNFKKNAFEVIGGMGIIGLYKGSSQTPEEGLFISII